MKHVGYDTETTKYTFPERDLLGLAQPGSFYSGTMKRAGRTTDTGPTKSGGYEGISTAVASESMEDKEYDM
jgi:hypothetical protein